MTIILSNLPVQKEELAKKRVRPVTRVRREPKTPVAAPAAAPDEREDTFWNTPGAAARTLHFTGDSLLDEEVDLANVSTTSFGTPISAAQRKLARRAEPATPEPEPEPELEYYQADDLADEDEVDDVLGEADDTIHPTTVVARAPEEHVSPEPAPEAEVTFEVAPSQPPEPAPAATPHHRQKVKVTTELERIVVRLFMSWKYEQLRVDSISRRRRSGRRWARSLCQATPSTLSARARTRASLRAQRRPCTC